MPKIDSRINPGSLHHVFNRAVDKQTIFYTDKDYKYFFEKIEFYKIKTKIEILAYVVLPNHWHFLIKEPESTPGVGNPRCSALIRFVSNLTNSYAKHYNSMHDRTGVVFQGRVKTKLIDNDSYLQTLINYINLNPIKHKIVKNINDWDYTSHHEYIYAQSHNLVSDSYLIDCSQYRREIKYYIKNISEMSEVLNKYLV